MALRRTVWLLTLATLLFSIAAPQAFASWQCEGHGCGIAPWVCCCESSAHTDPCSDRPCEAVRSPGGSPGVSHGRCPCVFALQTPDATRMEKAAVLVAPLLAPGLLPRAPLTVVPACSEVALAGSGERAPPLPSVLHRTPGLRAPPAA